MLSELRRIKLGQHGVGAAELTVRSLGPVVEARVLRPPVRSLKAVVHAPAARGATKQAIEAAVRHAAASTIATDQADLQHTYQLDIAAETAGYIRKCVDAGRILPASEVVTTFSADSDEVRYSMPKWVLARAYTLRKGADVEGIDPQTKTRFISLWKDLE